MRAAKIGGAAVLPYEGAMDRLAGFAIPDNNRLAMIGDADGGDLLRRAPCGVERRGDHGTNRLPDLPRIVLDEAGLGIMLLDLAGGAAAALAGAVEDQGARAGRTLVNGEDECFHDCAF